MSTLGMYQKWGFVLRAEIVMRSVEFEIDCTVINGLVSEVVEVRWEKNGMLTYLSTVLPDTSL